MIRTITLLLALTLVSALTQYPLKSPCPNVFNYELMTSEPGTWYGVVTLSSDSTLHSLRLNIVLDSKAEVLGNWIGNVTTSDNIDFNIENTKMKILPGSPTAMRLFIKHNLLSKPPRVQVIRLNGREICNAKFPTPVIDLTNNEIIQIHDLTVRTRRDTHSSTPTPSRRTTDDDIKRISDAINNAAVDTRPSDTVIQPYDTKNNKPIYKPGHPYDISSAQSSVQNSVGLPNLLDGGSSTAPPSPDEDNSDSNPDD